MTLQYDKPDFQYWLLSLFKSLLLMIIHNMEPLVICDSRGELISYSVAEIIDYRSMSFYGDFHGF